MTGIEDEELEARLRRKWFGGASKATKPVLSESDGKVAAKLMGRFNAERLAKSARPFRYRPPVVRAEYYEVPSSDFSFGGWSLDLFTDGVRTKIIEGADLEDCMVKVRELTAKGIMVRRLETEWMRQQKALTRSAPSGMRGVIMDQLKGFRL